jgi:hypothetical protein
MENEENRGLINKKASEDQFIAFVSFFGALFSLSLSLSLSYSWTLRVFLEHSWRSVAYLDLEQEGKGRAGKHKRTSGSTTTTGFFLQVPSCMYDFLLVLACMAYACGFLVMICHWHGGFPGLTVVFPSLSISWIAMVLWVFSFFFLVGSHVPLVGLSY